MSWRARYPALAALSSRQSRYLQEYPGSATRLSVSSFGQLPAAIQDLIQYFIEAPRRTRDMLYGAVYNLNNENYGSFDLVYYHERVKNLNRQSLRESYLRYVQDQRDFYHPGSAEYNSGVALEVRDSAALHYLRMIFRRIGIQMRRLVEQTREQTRQFRRRRLELATGRQ